MKKRKNAASVWIRVRGIGQSGGTDPEGDFLSVSERWGIVRVSSAAASAAAFAGSA